jgi:hypothetical protein
MKTILQLPSYETIPQSDTAGWVIFLGISILLALVFLFLVVWFGWWKSLRPHSLSPYTGLPLRRATDISYFSTERIYRFLYYMKDYDNRIFDLKKAALCRETGRLFQDCVTWYDATFVDWTFLQKRYPGSYVSWGSLNRDQQEAMRNAHDSLEGFQTGFSSPTPSPRSIEPQYAFAKPGPLYVDIETKTLLGWKVVPDTELEVLIVQKPKK